MSQLAVLHYHLQTNFELTLLFQISTKLDIHAFHTERVNKKDWCLLSLSILLLCSSDVTISRQDFFFVIITGITVNARLGLETQVFKT